MWVAGWREVPRTSYIYIVWPADLLLPSNLLSSNNVHYPEHVSLLIVFLAVFPQHRMPYLEGGAEKLG